MTIYLDIVNKFGIEPQLRQFTEEFAEAYIELNKFARGRQDADAHKALTELAHLSITTKQMIVWIDETMETYPEVYADELKRARRLVE